MNLLLPSLLLCCTSAFAQPTLPLTATNTSSSLEFDTNGPSPLLLAEAHEVVHTNTPFYLHMPVQTNYPSWMIQYSTNYFHTWYDCDLIDGTNTQYNLTFFVTNLTLFPSPLGMWRAQGWKQITAGAHQH